MPSWARPETERPALGAVDFGDNHHTSGVIEGQWHYCNERCTSSRINGAAAAMS